MADFDALAENDEWNECFDAVDKWEQQQDLIEKSNRVENEEAPKPEYMEVLHRCFGHKNFRPMQWKIINSVINDRKDNCAIMATGYGKSLCFQYPSVYLGGVTVVISPLISLMEDQVLSLEMCNISACYLGTAQTRQKDVIQEIFEQKYSLVYITPEFCCGDYGQYLLKRMNNELSLILIAIDEAHCVSSWGHDFRYQYRDLGKLRDLLPGVPILAVTATAAPKVRSDIISCLKLRNPQVLCSGFDRPNLFFTVRLKGGGIIPDLRTLMVTENNQFSFPGSTIIYCITRKQTEEVAKLLNLKGIQCLPYHAGMTPKARKDAHEKFVKDKVKMIVATIAFGMGIDKPDVRNIIHYGASKDLESYYQEVGRAGRDGQPSKCITFYNNADFDLHQTIRELNGNTDKNRVRHNAMSRLMLQYLENRNCRRQFILRHFEGSVPNKGPQRNCCDNCTRNLSNVSDSKLYEGLNEQGLYNFAPDARLFLKAVDAMDGKFGQGTYILLLRGSRSNKLFAKYQTHHLHGSGKHQTEDWWKAVGKILEREEYLQKTIKKGKKKAIFSIYGISSKGKTFMKTPPTTQMLLQPSPEVFKLLKLKSQPLVLTNPQRNETSPFNFRSPDPESLPRLKATSSSQPSSKPLVKSRTLKLLEPVSTSTSRNITEEVSDSNNDTHSEERLQVYRLLMNTRADLATAVDCMPYMVASNEALMKMAEMKPLTIKELRMCRLEGFTEAKINRFGDEFVKTIRNICQLGPVEEQNNIKRTIEDILAERPLPGSNITAAAEVSYSMYKSGLSVQEIATKRGVLYDTVLSHLVDAMKMGHPIKMIDLNVTDEMRETILDSVKNLPKEANRLALTTIKNVCPPDITSNAIKVVLAYQQVRNHLAKLQVAYEDFETTCDDEQLLDLSGDMSFSLLHGVNSQKSQLSLSTDKKNEKRYADNEPNSISLSTNPCKKQKVFDVPSSSTSDDLAFLDSPPRSTQDSENLVTSTQTLTNKSDLDNTLLEDDFFDDVSLDYLEKDCKIKLSQNTEMVNCKLNDTSDFVIKPSPKFQFVKPKPCKSFQLEPVNVTPAVNIIKKFQFKSNVPKSVMQSAQQLCSTSLPPS